MTARIQQFIFPAIVDRSPLIVAVGTSGNSPTLARRVRTQIEALLPQRLGHLADYAGRWRDAVKAALPQLPLRLRFWEAFLNGPIATQLLAGHENGADEAMRSTLAAAREAGTANRGEVYLIGVGPGDPDLLTIRALQLLQQADVLLYDRLVSPAILDRARRDAVRINVGKSPGVHDMTQDYINGQLLEWARRGMRVARVKGGDPFVFGRGGEELAAMREAGIPVVVVPGITAGLGAAASASVPLTQRGHSQSVTFVTATGAGSGSLEWSALARTGQTVVFYMGGAQIAYIAAQLAGHGLPASHPVAIVERATWDDERVLPATLGEVAALASNAALRSPSLLIVGEVAAFAIARGLPETARPPVSGMRDQGIRMSLRRGFVDAVGNTPLIRLEGLSRETGCEILGKAEFMNPGGSVKDRAAKWIVLDAEARGVLKPGGTVVEGTAGNTGIGLAHVCNARGYRCVIVMPDNQSAGEIPPDRGARRRDAKGEGRPLQRSEPVPACRAPIGGGTAGCGLGQPVRQHGQPPRPCRVDRTRDLGTDGWPHGCLCCSERHRRHAGGNSPST